jgi:hypothetical protein
LLVEWAWFADWWGVDWFDGFGWRGVCGFNAVGFSRGWPGWFGSKILNGDSRLFCSGILVMDSLNRDTANRANDGK